MSVLAQSRRSLPHGATAAAVFGWIGAGIAAAIGSRWTDISPIVSTFARLDQLQMLLTGACVGALVLVGRALHRRESAIAATLAGALLGASGALIGATLAWSLPIGSSPRSFLFTRFAGWAVAAALTSVTLSLWSRSLSFKRIGETAVLGAIGGITAGAVFSMPGPSELWLPIATTIFGATVGFAAVGPGLWRAPLIMQTLPARDTRRGMLSLNERSVDNGWSMQLSEARIGCVDGRVYVYPPPGGVGIDGHSYYRPVELTHDALLTVGRARYRAILSAWRA